MLDSKVRANSSSGGLLAEPAKMTRGAALPREGARGRIARGTKHQPAHDQSAAVSAVSASKVRICGRSRRTLPGRSRPGPGRPGGTGAAPWSPGRAEARVSGHQGQLVALAHQGHEVQLEGRAAAWMPSPASAAPPATAAATPCGSSLPCRSRPTPTAGPLLQHLVQQHSRTGPALTVDGRTPGRARSWTGGIPWGCRGHQQALRPVSESHQVKPRGGVRLSRKGAL